MVKALNLIEEIENLLAESTVETDPSEEELEERARGLYFHQKLHKANDSAHFKPSKADAKLFGDDSIVHHDVNDGIKKATHAIVGSKVSPGTFEHHTFEYDGEGKQTKHKITSFSTREDALNNLRNKSNALKTLAVKAKTELASAKKTAKELSKGK